MTRALDQKLGRAASEAELARERGGRVVALRDTRGDGVADTVVTVLDGLNQPHGLAFGPGKNPRLYVGFPLALAAAIGGYVGLNIAALCAAIEFGLQPTLFHTANGTPLYAPFHLAQTIPAMALAHLTIAGAAELLMTAGVVAYLQRANLPLLRINHPGVVDTDAELAPQSGRPALRWGLIGIATMIVLSPLGLLAPGGAYGEDAPIDLNLRKAGLSAIPSGLQHYNGFWKHTLLTDYGFSSGRYASLGYLLSAILGALAVGAAIFLFIGGARLVARRRPSAQTG